LNIYNIPITTYPKVSCSIALLYFPLTFDIRKLTQTSLIFLLLQRDRNIQIVLNQWRWRWPRLYLRRDIFFVIVLECRYIF